eukprot:7377518-Prymnesium_polylepis.1
MEWFSRAVTDEPPPMMAQHAAKSSSCESPQERTRRQWCAKRQRHAHTLGMGNGAFGSGETHIELAHTPPIKVANDLLGISETEGLTSWCIASEDFHQLFRRDGSALVHIENLECFLRGRRDDRHAVFQACDRLAKPGARHGHDRSERAQVWSVRFGQSRGARSPLLRVT